MTGRKNTRGTVMGIDWLGLFGLVGVVTCCLGIVVVLVMLYDYLFGGH
jgi:hypothetical protein